MMKITFLAEKKKPTWEMGKNEVYQLNGTFSFW